MINCLSIAACILGMVGSALFAYQRYKAVFLLSIVNGCIFTALNTAVAMSAPGQEGVALMIVPSVWMIGTSVVGLRRLSRCP